MYDWQRSLIEKWYMVPVQVERRVSLYPFTAEQVCNIFRAFKIQNSHKTPRYTHNVVQYQIKVHLLLNKSTIK
jgi:hypothetical protein